VKEKTKTKYQVILELASNVKVMGIGGKTSWVQ